MGGRKEHIRTLHSPDNIYNFFLGVVSSKERKRKRKKQKEI